MSEADLEKLKGLATPTPDGRARAKARAAALASFNEIDASQKKDATVTKENVIALRPMHIDPKCNRRSLMRLSLSRRTYAVAASLAVLAIGVPVAWQATRIAPNSPRMDALGGLPKSTSKIAGAATGSSEAAKDDALRHVPATTKPLFEKPALVLQPEAVRKRVARATGRTVVTNAPLDARSADASPVTGGRTHARIAKNKQRPPAEKKLIRRIRTATASPDRRAAVPRPPGALLGTLSLSRDRTVLAAEVRQKRLLGKQRLADGYFLDGDRLARVAPEYVGRDLFESFRSSPLRVVSTNPVSTFSADVDTSSYAIVRRSLNAGRLPQKNAVRIEELINYFTYDYATPESREKPFRPQVRVMPSPWNPQTLLMHVAIKGYALKAAERPRANLVFLIDVSGSMQGSDRLPLLQNAFRMLLDNLRPDDTVGLVTYASGSSIALKSTKVSEKAKILAAIDGLSAGGSTAGAKGIQDAYALAEANFDKAAVNRVILGTDGDFNVGIRNREELKSYIETKRKSGIFLSILGVGHGNLNDALMQTLAQNGNGTAAYIDTIGEARKVLVEEAASTLFPIAKDVKFQIEFNPARVSHYRLIGYETRALRREGFNNDKVDAGDTGSGHAVTAIYEMTPVGAEQKLVDGLRYQPTATRATGVKPDTKAEFAHLRIRYKLPKLDKSNLIALPVTSAMQARSVAATDADIRFSTAVAAFGQLLRGGIYMREFGYDDVIALASSAKGADPFGLRAEFVNLVRLAKSAR
ncbi:MAG: vWA domain-containing protein [Hyphomicrobiaceae bacterium]